MRSFHLFTQISVCDMLYFLPLKHLKTVQSSQHDKKDKLAEKGAASVAFKDLVLNTDMLEIKLLTCAFFYLDKTRVQKKAFFNTNWKLG